MIVSFDKLEKVIALWTVKNLTQPKKLVVILPGTAQCL